jgi:hypothetical protein
MTWNATHTSKSATIPIYRVPFYFSINTIHELLTLCMPFRYTLD